MKIRKSVPGSKRYFVKKTYLLPLLILLFAISAGDVFGQGSASACQITPPPGASTPTSGGKIRVKIDHDENEMFEFYLTSGSNCEIFVTNEEGGINPDDDGTTYGARGNIIKHKPDAGLDQATGGSCSMSEKDACRVYWYRWRSGMDSKCGDCSLSKSNTEYRPKGDILCGFDGKWHLCDSDFYGSSQQGKFFKSGEKGYRCTKDNEWVASEMCSNNADDDNDGKIDCADENCYGTDSTLINLESGQTIKCHDKDLTTTKIFYHPSCEPDTDKDKIAGQGTKALNICEQQGLTFSFRKKYNYAVNPALPQDNLNQCCGDDTTDCGKVEMVSTSSSLLCSIDVNNQNQFSKWIRSDGTPDAATGGGHGNIKYVPCNQFEYLSSNNRWTKCAGVFEGNPAEDKYKISANGHDYLCLGSGQGSVVECCGDLSRCNSKGPDGQRLKTGEFRTKKCGNGVADAGEQCGEPNLNCPTGQSCNGCICSGAPRACSPTDQCRTNTDCTSDPNRPVCSSCSCVAAPSGCTVADQCRTNNDCLIVGQVCSSCRCVTPPPLCGNGNIDGSEQCDGTNLGGKTCASQGLGSGSLSCKADCTLDTRGCSGAGPGGTGTCGDGVIQTPNSNGKYEECDGTNLGGETCSTILGPGSIGILSCRDCVIDTSRCRTTTGSVVAIDSITGNSILQITGYATAPNRFDVVQQVYSDDPALISDCNAFTNEVTCRLNTLDSRWGRNGKRGNINDLSEDAIAYSGTNGPGGVDIIDIIASCGSPNAQPSWQDVTQATRDRGTIGAWVQPVCSSTGGSGGSGGSGGGSGSGSGSASGTGTSSGKYYCTPQGTFEFKTLDAPSPRPSAPNFNNKFTCTEAGLSWTGTKCCGEPDQRPEYYNDPAGSPTNTETSPNRFPNGCTGSCDAPYFRLKYEQDVLNAIIAVGGVDLSTQARVDSYRQAVTDELKSKGFIGVINPTNCNGNPSPDSIIIGKQGDQYAEYYDIVIGHGTPNPSPGIGYIEPANWRRCPGCGQSSPATCVTGTSTPSSTSAGSSGIGGCWNSRFVSSISFVDDTDNSVINYGGVFHGCAIDKKNYNTRNDALLAIKDTHTRAQLVTNRNYCFNDPEKNYVCSYTEKWIQTDGKDKSHFSTSPLENAAQKSECCAAMECWSGEKCVENQKDNPLAPLLGDGYKCIDGNWKKLPKKCSPDENACGYCGEESQCLLNPLSQSISSRCINSGEYSGDDYCDNGQWSTRTKLLTLMLLGLKTQDYVLFCDDKQNTLNNLKYVIDSGEVAETVIANLQANNFCVLKNKDKTIVATSINKNLEEVRGGFNILGITSCGNAKNDSNYYSCDSTNRVWYNKKLKSIIYSQSPISVTPSQETSSSLSDIIKIIIEAIKRLIIPPPFDESYVQSIKRFDTLFLAQQDQSSIRGTMEGKIFKNVVIEYNNFDKINICDYINSFNEAGSFTLSGISCRKEGNNYYVLAQGSEFTSFNPESVWTDLTAKLRLK